MRIVSFLPAGTEIAWAIGAGPDLVGRSHECDYPAQVAGLPVVSRPALDLDHLSGAEMDRAVAERPAGKVEAAHARGSRRRTFWPGCSAWTPAVTTISPGVTPEARTTLAGS